MQDLEETKQACPYCAEVIELFIDCAGEAQSYVEDCPVCCRPILVKVMVDVDGDISVSLARDDD